MIIACLLFMVHIGVIDFVHGTLVFSLFTLVLYQLYKRGRVDANALAHSEIWMLFMFGLMYAMLGETNLMYLEYYLVAPVLTFLAGWVYSECSDDPWKALRTVIFALLFTCGVRAVLNVSINIGNSRLEMRDFFQGLRIATGSGALNTMIFSLAMYSIFFAKGRERIGLWVLLGISAVYSLMLGTRTQIVILVLVFVCMYSLYVFEKKRVLGLVKVIGVVAAVAVVAFIVYSGDLFGIGTAINESNLMLRFVINDYTGVAEGSTSLLQRLQMPARAMKEIAKHPFGGNIDSAYYHNMILDIARISGIVPMFFMIAYLLRMAGNLLKIYRHKVNRKMCFMILSVYMGFWLNFMVEPVMEGLLNHFLMMCLLDGMVTYIAHRELT